MLKKSKIIAMILAMLLVLTACGGGGTKTETPATTETPGKTEEVELRFSWWGGDERHEKTLEAIKLFESKNPGITIKAEYGGWQGHQEKVTSQIAGKTEPDILQVNWNWLWIFSKDGNGFYDLNEVKDIITLDNYDEKLIEKTTINGKVNAIPVGIGGKVFYFNETTYQKAGLEIPKTFADLEAAAAVFKEKLGNDYFPIDLDQYATFLMVLYKIEQETGKPFMDENNNVVYTVEELAKGFEWYQGLVDKGVVPSMELRAGSGDVPMDQMPQWIQGKFGATYEWDSAVNKFLAALEGDQSMVTGEYLTGFGSNDSALTKISMAFAISKNSKHPKEAAKFLEFLVSDPEAAEILGTSRGVPANKKAIELLESKSLLSGLNYEGNVAASTHMGHGIGPYFEDAELQNLYRSTVEEFGYGLIDAKTAAEKIVNGITARVAEITK